MRAKSHTNRALAHVELKQYARALEDCDSALKLVPRLVRGLWVRGIAHYRKGDHAQAVKDLEHALKLLPLKDAKAVKIRQLLETCRARLKKRRL